MGNRRRRRSGGPPVSSGGEAKRRRRIELVHFSHTFSPPPPSLLPSPRPNFPIQTQTVKCATRKVPVSDKKKLSVTFIFNFNGSRYGFFFLQFTFSKMRKNTLSYELPCSTQPNFDGIKSFLFFFFSSFSSDVAFHSFNLPLSKM